MRTDYERVLKQRGALLKTAGSARRAGGAGDIRTLDVWDGHLARHGAELLAGRLDLVAEPRAARGQAAYAGVAPESAPARSATSAVSASRSRLRWARRRAGRSGGAGGGTARRAGKDPAQEIDRGVSLLGPHRDELELLLGEAPAKGYASHGESWSFALALRLGALRVAAGRRHRTGARSSMTCSPSWTVAAGPRWPKVAAAAEQVLVTAAVPDDVPAELAGIRFDVAAGRSTCRLTEPTDHGIRRSGRGAAVRVEHFWGQTCG